MQLELVATLRHVVIAKSVPLKQLLCLLGSVLCFRDASLCNSLSLIQPLFALNFHALHLTHEPLIVRLELFARQRQCFPLSLVRIALLFHAATCLGLHQHLLVTDFSKHECFIAFLLCCIALFFSLEAPLSCYARVFGSFFSLLLPVVHLRFHLIDVTMQLLDILVLFGNERLEAFDKGASHFILELSFPLFVGQRTLGRNELTLKNLFNYKFKALDAHS